MKDHLDWRCLDSGQATFAASGVRPNIRISGQGSGGVCYDIRADHQWEIALRDTPLVNKLSIDNLGATLRTWYQALKVPTFNEKEYHMRFLLLATVCAAPVLAEEIVVKMAGAQYSPATIVAAVGDTIRFINDDDMDHNVFVATAGYAIDLGKQEPGSEVSYTVGKAGSFEIECVFHDFMLAKVEVTE